MHFRQKQKCLLWNGGPWKLLSLLFAKMFIRKELGLKKLWNIPPTFCKFHRSTYSTTLYVHVSFIRISTLMQIMWHKSFMGFVFCLSVSIIGYVLHTYFLIVFIILVIDKELCFVCIICALCIIVGILHNIQGKTPQCTYWIHKFFVPKTLVCQANERLKYLLPLTHWTLGVEDWP